MLLVTIVTQNIELRESTLIPHIYTHIYMYIKARTSTIGGHTRKK